jgi:hypothetical protein
MGLLTGCASIEDTARDAQVIVTPENPNDDDNIKAYVTNEEVFDFYWVREGVTYKIETGSYSILNRSFTEPGDVWEVHAFVPASTWYDSYEYGSASVEIKE